MEESGDGCDTTRRSTDILFKVHCWPKHLQYLQQNVNSLRDVCTGKYVKIKKLRSLHFWMEITQLLNTSTFSFGDENNSFKFLFFLPNYLKTNTKGWCLYMGQWGSIICISMCWVFFLISYFAFKVKIEFEINNF